jgi:hypothetical protein
MLLKQLGFCAKCKYYKEDGIPKRKCLVCSRAYTNEYKTASEYKPRAAIKARREASDSGLSMLYQRVKEQYFRGKYLPEAKHILFTWKNRKGFFGGWASKSRKEIRIGYIYKYAFVRKTVSTNQMAVTETFNDQKRVDLVLLMIHEALHLRLPHHRKSFRAKEAYHKSLFSISHIDELYEGLIKE